jgi:uncharacterized repeat protein (TIGR03803 family)
LTTLFDFDGADGAEPNSLVSGSDGNFYGTTAVGGVHNGGTFFRLEPAGKLSTLISFDPVTGQLWSVGYLIQAANGNFYGVDPLAGTTEGGGAVFSLAPAGRAFRVADLVNFSLGAGTVIPSAASVRASGITSKQATLLGIVNPNGVNTTVHFELSTANQYDGPHLKNAIYSNDVGVGSGTKGRLLKATFTGLSPSTTYYFQIYSSNDDNFEFHDEGPQFSTGGPPTVTYDPPSAIASQTATLNASVNPRDHKTTVYFQYGTTTTYSLKTPKVTISPGFFAAPVSVMLGNLTPNTQYHYRIVAESGGGTTNGADETFTTAP